MSSFGLEPLSVPEMDNKVECCLRSGPELKDERNTVGEGGFEAILENLN